MQTEHGYMSRNSFAFWQQWFQAHYQQEVTLEDLHFIGQELYQDQNACSMYGYTPDKAYAKGIRIVGRTALEYCTDTPAKEIASAVQQYTQDHHLDQPFAVIDPFAGAGNLFYHTAQALKAAYGLGLDADPVVAQLTARNLALVSSPWQVGYGSWQSFDPTSIPDSIRTLVIIIDPPWGAGHTSEGVNLQKTEPPVPDILATLAPKLRHQTLWVIKTFEYTVPESIAIVKAHLQQPEEATLTSMVSGANSGYILGITN